MRTSRAIQTNAPRMPTQVGGGHHSSHEHGELLGELSAPPFFCAAQGRGHCAGLACPVTQPTCGAPWRPCCARAMRQVARLAQATHALWRHCDAALTSAPLGDVGLCAYKAGATGCGSPQQVRSIAHQKAISSRCRAHGQLCFWMCASGVYAAMAIEGHQAIAMGGGAQPLPSGKTRFRRHRPWASTVSVCKFCRPTWRFPIVRRTQGGPKSIPHHNRSMESA